jgi:DNA invertase Pin-like site-specific DNA recombinase
MYERKSIDELETVRYVTYARVSSDKQELESQKSEIASWCKIHHNSRYVSHGDFSEKVSTLKHWSKRKEGLMEIIGLAKARKIDHVVCYSIFRLGRTEKENHEIAEYLKTWGVSMTFVSENCYYGDGSSDGDKLVFSIMSSLARIGRDRKSRRAKRGHKDWRKCNPDKIWGQQPKLRGKTLEMFIELYNARKDISRSWDKRRTPDSDGTTNKYSYREMAEILKINKSTISRYVARLCEAGKIKPRSKTTAKSLDKIKHISEEARLHAMKAEIKPKRSKTIDLWDDEEKEIVTLSREAPMYLEDGTLHPAYADETLGMFGKVTKDLKAEFETMEFKTLFVK